MRTIPLLGLAALALTASLACAAQTPATSGTLRLGGQAQRANPAGPLAAANALVPGIAPLPAGRALAQAELRSRWRALNMALQLDTERPDGGPARSHARVNELYGTADLVAWQLSAGKQVVSWDVGYAWHPNDLVQQEPRRQLGPVVLEGRPLLQLEHFDAERATSLVWVNPQRQSRASSAQLGPDERALASTAAPAWVRRRPGSPARRWSCTARCAGCSVTTAGRLIRPSAPTPVPPAAPTRGSCRRWGRHARRCSA